MASTRILPRLLATTGLALTFAGSGVWGVPAPDQGSGTDAADAKRLVRALDVHQGATVAEVGAGNGSLTLVLAREVGPSGRVFTSELGEDRVKALRQAVDHAAARNVTVIDSAARETGLREACCDAVFMRNVYHHFADPPAMNASLRASLKPCGRLAILDFAPDAGESAPPVERAARLHGVTRATAKAELEQAGFDVLVDEATNGRSFFLVAQRPASSGETCPTPPSS